MRVRKLEKSLKSLQFSRHGTCPYVEFRRSLRSRTLSRSRFVQSRFSRLRFIIPNFSRFFVFSRRRKEETCSRRCATLFAARRQFSSKCRCGKDMSRRAETVASTAVCSEARLPRGCAELRTLRADRRRGRLCRRAGGQTLVSWTKKKKGTHCSRSTCFFCPRNERTLFQRIQTSRGSRRAANLFWKSC